MNPFDEKKFYDRYPVGLLCRVTYSVIGANLGDIILFTKHSKSRGVIYDEKQGKLVPDKYEKYVVYDLIYDHGFQKLYVDSSGWLDGDENRFYENSVIDTKRFEYFEIIE